VARVSLSRQDLGEISGEVRGGGRGKRSWAPAPR
jgi:hypothetical protein